NAARGLQPEIMGMGPVLATRESLSRTGWDLGEVDAVELNEAFATQSLACIRALGLDEDKTHAWGGAIPLCHPLGSSGSRLTSTLVIGPDSTARTRGSGSMCSGAGQGTTTALERV